MFRPILKSSILCYKINKLTYLLGLIGIVARSSGWNIKWFDSLALLALDWLALPASEACVEQIFSLYSILRAVGWNWISTLSADSCIISLWCFVEYHSSYEHPKLTGSNCCNKKCWVLLCTVTVKTLVKNFASYSIVVRTVSAVSMNL